MIDKKKLTSKPTFGLPRPGMPQRLRRAQAPQGVLGLALAPGTTGPFGVLLGFAKKKGQKGTIQKGEPSKKGVPSKKGNQNIRKG